MKKVRYDKEINSINIYNDLQLYSKIKLRVIIKAKYKNQTYKMYQRDIFEGIVLNISPFHIVLKEDDNLFVIRIKEVIEYEVK